MVFMSQAQVDDGQHHEDEGLQGDDEDVEHGPREAERGLHPPWQQRDQNKDQFTRIHVAKKAQCQGNRPREMLDKIQQDIERDEDEINWPIIERMQHQLLAEVEYTFNLYAIKNYQAKHRNRHCKSLVQVGGRDRAQIRYAKQGRDAGQ